MSEVDCLPSMSCPEYVSKHLLASIQHSNECGPSEQRKRKVSEDSDSQQPCRKRLKCVAEAAVARRKLHFPVVAANSPSVTVSYINACIAITYR